MKMKIHLQLQIQDKGNTVIKSVLNEIIEAVAIQQVADDDNPSDESSSTPPCSQMPHIDPYACKKETSHDEIR